MPPPPFKSSLSNGPDGCYPLVFLPDLFWKIIFVDDWSRFLWSGCSSCHLANNAKVLWKLRAQTLVSENHSLASSPFQWTPVGKVVAASSVLVQKKTQNSLLWPPCIADADIIFLSCFFFLPLLFSPDLSSHRLHVYHTSTHGVALVQI